MEGAKGVSGSLLKRVNMLRRDAEAAYGDFCNREKKEGQVDHLTEEEAWEPRTES